MDEPSSKDDARPDSTDDTQDIDLVFERHRAGLRRMVELRLNARLRARVDASDVVQEAYLEATRRLDDYRANPEMPVHLWLRFLTGQALAGLYRHHLGVQARDPRREQARAAAPAACTASMATELTGKLTSPSLAAAREETRRRVEAALDSMDPLDREVLVLRQFEQLSNADAAVELELTPAAASKRFARALVRLRELLEPTTGSGDEETP